MRTYFARLSVLLSCLAPALAQHVVEGPEPNDLTGTPTPISCGMRADGVLTPSDSDYYAIVVSSPSLVRAYTSYGRNSTSSVDTIVEFRNSGDTLLASDDDAGVSVFSYAGLHVTTPGLYYITVRGFSSTTSGAYTLDVYCDEPVIAEGAEPNNSPLAGGTPTTGACGATHAGNIDVANDEDWYLFVHAGGGVNVTTGPGGPDNGTAGLAIVDTTIEVFDANGVAVPGSFDDDGGESLYSSVTLTNLAAGSYYVKVRGFSTRVGWYGMRIGCNEPASLLGDVGPAAGAPPGCIGALEIRGTSPTGDRVRPRIGTTFTLDATGLPPGSGVFHVVGLSLLAVPVDLSPFGGGANCFVSVTPDAAIFRFADANGGSTVVLPIPNVTVLTGVSVHFQVVTIAPLGATNAVSTTIGNLAFP